MSTIMAWVGHKLFSKIMDCSLVFWRLVWCTLATVGDFLMLLNLSCRDLFNDTRVHHWSFDMPLKSYFFFLFSLSSLLFETCASQFNNVFFLNIAISNRNFNQIVLFPKSFWSLLVCQNISSTVLYRKNIYRVFKT